MAGRAARISTSGHHDRKSYNIAASTGSNIKNAIMRSSHYRPLIPTPAAPPLKGFGRTEPLAASYSSKLPCAAIPCFLGCGMSFAFFVSRQCWQ